jgi:mRNA-degrading endonuclease toxin of MazEF toxin-antitoxin module
LEGDREKDRPVVIVSPNQVLKAGGAFVVVACSTSVLESDESRIALPNRGDTPQTKSGLPRRTWVVPRWFLPVERDRLRDYIGHLTGEVLKRVVIAVEKAILASIDDDRPGSVKEYHPQPPE